MLTNHVVCLGGLIGWVHWLCMRVCWLGTLPYSFRISQNTIQANNLFQVTPHSSRTLVCGNFNFEISITRQLTHYTNSSKFKWCIMLKQMQGKCESKNLLLRFNHLHTSRMELSLFFKFSYIEFIIVLFQLSKGRFKWVLVRHQLFF